MPLSLDVFRLPALGVELVDGLSGAIDEAAAAAPASHAFLRYGWYAAAIAAYGGQPRTLVVREGERAILAMPLTALGPAALGLVQVPGSYWPWRSVPMATDAGTGAAALALAALAESYRGLRLGPVGDDDPAAMALLAAARAGGWAVLDRFVAHSWVLDLAARTAEAWPRGSTLRKNRFHEKHLAAHGALDWRFLGADDWPCRFADLATIEERSWIASRTDGRDAKFTDGGHGYFWRAAAVDPALARMFRAALLEVDGRPAAFSFDIDIGATIYAIANSYDPALAKHSPGKLLAYRNLTAAVARGAQVVDWGAGDSGYKQTLGAEQGPALRDWLLLRPGVPALVGRALAGWWRRSGQRESGSARV